VARVVQGAAGGVPVVADELEEATAPQDPVDDRDHRLVLGQRLGAVRTGQPAATEIS